MPECGQKEGYFILHQAFEMDGEIFPIKIQMNSPLLPDVFTKLLFETLTALDDNALKRLSHHQPPQQQQRQKPKSLDQDADERRQSCQAAAIDSIGHVLHGTEWEQRKNDLQFFREKGQGNNGSGKEIDNSNGNQTDAHWRNGKKGGDINQHAKGPNNKRAQ